MALAPEGFGGEGGFGGDVGDQWIAQTMGKGSSGGKKPDIYMGGGYNMVATPGMAMTLHGKAVIKGAKVGGDRGRAYVNTESYDNAVALPVTWDQNTLKQFVNKGILNKVPGFDTSMGMPEIQGAWQRLVDASTIFNAGSGEKKWTPWDVLDSYGGEGKSYGTVTKGDWVFDVATGERIKYVGKTSRTSTQKKFDLSSPEDVKVLTGQVLRELLGRAPNDKELAQYKASINGYEKAHPTVTKTTEQLSPDLASGSVDVTSQTSTTSGGVSDAARASLVQDPTVDTKEFGKYQAATTYYDALLQMMGGS